jgi:hypothetical protein
MCDLEFCQQFYDNPGLVKCDVVGIVYGYPWVLGMLGTEKRQRAQPKHRLLSVIRGVYPVF